MFDLFLSNVKNAVLDTIYSIGMNNIETNQIDTIIVNSMNIKSYKNDALFYDIFNVY